MQEEKPHDLQGFFVRRDHEEIRAEPRQNKEEIAIKKPIYRIFVTVQ